MLQGITLSGFELIRGMLPWRCWPGLGRVRNLSDETHRALRLRAAAHGRSTEAEIRAILDEAARPAARVRVGAALVELGRGVGGVDLEIARDAAPARGASFE